MAEESEWIDNPENGPELAGIYLKAAIIAAGGSITVTREQVMSRADIEIDGDGVGDVTLRIKTD